MGPRRSNTTARRLGARSRALGALALAILATFASAGSPGPDVAAGAGVPQGARPTPTSLVATLAAAPDRGERPTRAARRGDRGRSARRDRLAAVENEAGERLAVGDERCRRNLARAAENGLRLPDGWRIRCVGPGLDWAGGSHWGVTCPYAECPEGGGPYVSISNPSYYVVAHELCHAVFGNDEAMADRCAAEHGASLATSPYR